MDEADAKITDYTEYCRKQKREIQEGNKVIENLQKKMEELQCIDNIRNDAFDKLFDRLEKRNVHINSDFKGCLKKLDLESKINFVYQKIDLKTQAINCASKITWLVM